MLETLKKHLTQTSFKTQLLLLFVMGLSILAIVVTLATTVSTHYLMENMFITRNKILVEAFAKQSTLALLYGSEENSRDAVRIVSAFQSVEYAAIHEVNHKRLFEYGKSVPGIDLPPPYPIQKELDAHWVFIEPVVVMNPIDKEPSNGGGQSNQKPQFLGYVKVLVSKSELQTIQSTIVLSNGLIIFILSAILYFIFRKLVNQMVEPLQTLTRTMKKREEGQTGVRASLQGAKELHTIGEAFNQMINVLEEREEALIKEMHSREKAEENVRQHQRELAHFSRLKTMGEMASGIAHELNQPLAAIVNYTGGCLERLQTEQTVPEFVAVVQKINDQAERAGAIIHRLKDFLRKGNAVTESVDVRLAIENVLKLIECELNQYEIKWSVQANECPKALMDKTHFEQVTLNIIQNAIEAMKENTEGKARLLTITVGLSGKEMVEVSIKDTGPGIPPEILEKLFEPFFTTKEEGMGMGLSIVSSILESHGGRIQVSSMVGEGAMFKLFMPGEGIRDK
ncbi:MAG: GHKL domain-containing protein [Gammaproteobacteria bacterium]|nr:GHKL domain-containing protein [Gammaproteobacteria bacterium]